MKLRKTHRVGMAGCVADAMRADHPMEPRSSFPVGYQDPLVARIQQVVVAEEEPDEPASVPRVLAERPAIGVPALGESVHYRPRGLRGHCIELAAYVVAKGPVRVKGQTHLGLTLRCMYPTHTNDLIVEGVLHGRTPGTWHWSGDKCEVYR